MMKRVYLQGVRTAVGVALIAGVIAPADAYAQLRRVEPRQSIGFNVGYFALRGEDARVEGDVLFADLDSLLFEIKDFNGASFGGEWLVSLGDYLEAGVGAGYYQRTVPSVYRGLINETTNTEIEQDLKLRIVPVIATVRFLPIGRNAPIEPYVGAGIGLFNWRYSETGEFVDLSDGTIFRDRFTANGTAVGPVVVAGLRAPISDVWTIGGEFRYQRAEGDIDLVESGLLGNKIDLTGWTTSFTVHLRF
jgi:hypothetical protein